MRTRRPAVVLGVVALTATILTAPAGARGGPPSDAGPPSGAGPDPSYEIDADRLAATLAAVEGSTGVPALSGEIAGAAWIGQVPEDWNGDLVVHAHGYRGEGPDLYVDPAPAYQFLVSQGYAWVASSYRRNSYDPGIGVIDTKNATVAFENLLKRTTGEEVDKTFLVGFSMGGHVTGAAIEQYPSLYDGAMPMCGVMGDVELFDYFLDYNVGAAAFAGLEPTYDYPAADWIAATVDPRIKPALSALGASPGWATASALTPAGLAFKDFVEVGSGGDRVTFDVAWEFWHAPVYDIFLGGFFFDLGQGTGEIAGRNGIVSQNTDMTYADEYGFDIDDDVLRVDAANRVRKAQGVKPAPIIEGTPQVPVLALHTTGDLFVPIEQLQIYAQEVRDNGVDDVLVTRAIRDVGHCSFTGEEIVAGYLDLFAWVEFGDVAKPAGDDIIADISSPALGCAFTSSSGGTGLRGQLESCP